MRTRRAGALLKIPIFVLIATSAFPLKKAVRGIEV